MKPHSTQHTRSIEMVNEWSIGNKTLRQTKRKKTDDNNNKYPQEEGEATTNKRKVASAQRYIPVWYRYNFWYSGQHYNTMRERENQAARTHSRYVCVCVCVLYRIGFSLGAVYKTAVSVLHTNEPQQQLPNRAFAAGFILSVRLLFIYSRAQRSCDAREE